MSDELQEAYNKWQEAMFQLASFGIQNGFCGDGNHSMFASGENFKIEIDIRAGATNIVPFPEKKKLPPRI